MSFKYLGLALSVAFAVVACSDNDSNPVSGSGSKGGSKSSGCNFSLNSNTWEFSQDLPGANSTIPATYKYTFGSGSSFTQTVSTYSNDASAKATCDNIDAIKSYSDAGISCQNGMMVTTVSSEMDYIDLGYSSKEDFFQATMATCRAANGINESSGGKQGGSSGQIDDYEDYDGDYSCTREGAKTKIDGIDAVCHEGMWTPAIMLESCRDGQKTTMSDGKESLPLVCENGAWTLDIEAYMDQYSDYDYDDYYY